MRIIAILLGLALAAAGGTIAYRAAFLAPAATVVISEQSARVRELPDLLRVGGGILLLVVGAMIAFFAARPRPPR